MSTPTVRPVPVWPPYSRIGGLPRIDWSDAYVVDLPAGTPRDADHWRRSTFGVGRETFAVTARTPNSVSVGSNHFHIDFRAVISVEGSRLTVTTVVMFNNVVGRAYIGLIGPFHRRIVPRMMRKAVIASASSLDINLT